MISHSFAFLKKTNIFVLEKIASLKNPQFLQQGWYRPRTAGTVLCVCDIFICCDRLDALGHALLRLHASRSPPVWETAPGIYINTGFRCPPPYDAFFSSFLAGEPMISQSLKIHLFQDNISLPPYCDIYNSIISCFSLRLSKTLSTHILPPLFFSDSLSMYVSVFPFPMFWMYVAAECPLHVENSTL